MIKTVLQFIGLAIVLVLVQVVFNKILLFGVAVPIVFIYLLLRLPVHTSVNWVMTIGFVLGLVIDVFSNTPGMNALCCTLLAAVRHPVIKAMIPREDDMSNPLPSIESLGMGIYTKYMLTLVMIYCVFIFLVQAFTLNNIVQTVLRIVSSGVLSSLIILGIDSLMSANREKGL